MGARCRPTVPGPGADRLFMDETLIKVPFATEAGPMPTGMTRT
ncbi:hypothetical protein GCM10019059_36360 [Camelimonas fluminis]|nr:hypothetical protein GCM10019059_36360 [Camelimonas fluminis]